MKLEDIVCSLELAIKLKEVGIKQKSLFQYLVNDDEIVLTNTGRPLWLHPDEHFGEVLIIDPNVKIYAALTSNELDLILPYSIMNNEKDFHGDLLCWYDKDGYTLEYCGEHLAVEDKNAANVRAKMILELIDRKLWSPNDNT